MVGPAHTVVPHPPAIMNPSEIVFPTPPVELRLRRSSDPTHKLEQAQVALAEGQRRLHEDLQALRAREENLRAYEARLRELQAHIELGTGRTTVPVRLPSQSPFGDETALSAAWSKLHRARELLEVEQRHLLDDRLLLKEELEDLQKREVTLGVREAQVAEREQRLTAPAKPSGKSGAGLFGFTRAPFKLNRAAPAKS